MKRQMTIGKKFALTSGGLIVLALAVGIISLYGLASLNGTVQSLTSDSVAGLDRITATQASVLELRGNVWRHIGALDEASRTKMDATFVDLNRQIENDLAEYEKTIFTPEDRALFSKIGPAYRQYWQAIQAPCN